MNTPNNMSNVSIPNCCKAMEHAIQNDYLHPAYTYTDDKVRIPLGIYLHRLEGGLVFKINVCPWCGQKIEFDEHEWEGEATK